MKALFAFVALASLSTLAGAAGFQVTIQDKDGKALPNVAVFATPVSGTVPASPPGREVLGQQGWEFTPYLSVVRRGTTVEFPNLDRTVHHVKSFSPAKEFEFFLSTEKGGMQTVLFDRAGPVIIYCMLHDWMRAYVYVTDTPWYAKSAEAGTVTLENLPAGEYRVTAWHPDLGQFNPPQVLTRAITKDEVAALQFKFPLSPRKPRPPKNLPQK